jgi:hypothetical protein
MSLVPARMGCDGTEAQDEIGKSPPNTPLRAK